jgi:uncharacterized SAM-binding protein YcdF (DUF218 family)
MLVLKQLIGTLAMPLPLALLLALVGLGCRMLRRHRTAAVLYIVGGCVAYLASIGVVSNLLLAPLESSYPPLREDVSLRGVAAVVVLGCSYEPRDGIPVTAALDPEGVVRLVEAVLLQRHFQASRLVLLGDPPERATSAAGYARLARDLGVPSTVMVQLPGSRDTHEEALHIAQLMGTTPFLLVTSAYHMPRAMKLMQRAGAHPVAAPTGYLGGDWRPGWGFVVPSSNALRRSERALHEYLGLLAIALALD